MERETLAMKNLAPDIFRQRLLVEGHYTIDMDADVVREFLSELAAALELRTYGEPIVLSPTSGMGKDENAGYDAFVPLIDSGISAYIWTARRFFSVVLYTCKGFNEARAVEFIETYFAVEGETAHMAF